METGVGGRHRASRSVNDRGFRSAGRAPCAGSCASGQNYAFASNRTRGLSLSPRRSTAISPQRKRRHRQTAGETPRFRTHGSRPIATEQEGASRVRPTARRALGAFRKKEGTFRRFSRVFSEKSPVFFCVEPAARHPGGRSRRRLPTAAKARGHMSRHSAAAATNTPR